MPKNPIVFTLDGRRCTCLLPEGKPKRLYVLCGWELEKLMMLLAEDAPEVLFFSTEIDGGRDFTQIGRTIAEGHLQAVTVTASGYTSGESLSFFQGRDDLQPWRRAQRVGLRTELQLNLESLRQDASLTADLELEKQARQALTMLDAGELFNAPQDDPLPAPISLHHTEAGVSDITFHAVMAPVRSTAALLPPWPSLYDRSFHHYPLARQPAA